MISYPGLLCILWNEPTSSAKCLTRNVDTFNKEAWDPLWKSHVAHDLVMANITISLCRSWLLRTRSIIAPQKRELQTSSKWTTKKKKSASLLQRISLLRRQTNCTTACSRVLIVDNDEIYCANTWHGRWLFCCRLSMHSFHDFTGWER
jgi:CDP-glycerol glycerophosphotransferase (TagB/SpsB family)